MIFHNGLTESTKKISGINANINLNSDKQATQEQKDELKLWDAVHQSNLRTMGLIQESLRHNLEELKSHKDQLVILEEDLKPTSFPFPSPSPSPSPLSLCFNCNHSI